MTVAKDGPGQEENSQEEEEDSPIEEDPKEGSPTTKRPQVSGKAEDKDKD